MSDLILVLNAGSSSIKFAVYDRTGETAPRLSGAIGRIGGAAHMSMRLADAQQTGRRIDAPDHGAAFEAVAGAVSNAFPGDSVSAVGHRIVHGGVEFADPTLLTPQTIAALEYLIPLAPLHQPHGLRGVRETARLYPQATQVACFDTAFHAGKPWVHDSFALPQAYYDAGLRRYGFHGLSCQSIVRTLRAEGYPLGERRIVIAHLGNGCSATAVKAGKGHATSMGFSTLDGLIMGTRTGRLDPGVLLYWLDQGMTSSEIARILYKQSGLLGLSGLSNDMRDLEAADDPAAGRAIEAFVASVVGEVCRLASTMAGLDTVVFCGGIGENAGNIRTRISEGLRFLGGAGPEILVRATREEEEIMLAIRSLDRDLV